MRNGIEERYGASAGAASATPHQVCLDLRATCHPPDPRTGIGSNNTHPALSLCSAMRAWRRLRAFNWAPRQAAADCLDQPLRRVATTSKVNPPWWSAGGEVSREQREQRLNELHCQQRGERMLAKGWGGCWQKGGERVWYENIDAKFSVTPIARAVLRGRSDVANMSATDATMFGIRRTLEEQIPAVGAASSFATPRGAAAATVGGARSFNAGTWYVAWDTCGRCRCCRFATLCPLARRRCFCFTTKRGSLSKKGGGVCFGAAGLLLQIQTAGLGLFVWFFFFYFFISSLYLAYPGVAA